MLLSKTKNPTELKRSVFNLHGHFNSQFLRQHIRLVQDSIQCKLCAKYLETNTEFYSHVKTKHSIQESVLEHEYYWSSYEMNMNIIVA